MKASPFRYVGPISGLGEALRQFMAEKSRQ
jgi:hypothetical protein